MSPRLRTRGLDGLARRLAARAVPPAAQAAAARTGAALADTLAAAGVPASLVDAGGRRAVRIADGPALGRERGSLQAPPAPWLAAALLAFRRRRP
ncbi:hypothetical protein [Xanthobacter tagetidis]|nr:hypothetical protein [Xanthobacter tagetidis]MBB6307017.1 hypothetical protein [Xanthobacter tagetidis]